MSRLLSRILSGLQTSRTRFRKVPNKALYSEADLLGGPAGFYYFKYSEKGGCRDISSSLIFSWDFKAARHDSERFQIKLHFVQNISVQPISISGVNTSLNQMSVENIQKPLYLIEMTHLCQEY